MLPPGVTKKRTSGSSYSIIVLTNGVHHFQATCATLPMSSTAAAPPCQDIWQRCFSDDSPSKVGPEAPRGVRRALDLHSATRMPLFPDPVTRVPLAIPLRRPGHSSSVANATRVAMPCWRQLSQIYEINLAKFDTGEHSTWHSMQRSTFKRAFRSYCKQNMSWRHVGKGKEGGGSRVNSGYHLL